MPSRTRVHGATIAASVAFHGALAAVLSWVALRSLSAAPQPGPIDVPPVSGAPADSLVELPTVGEGILVEEQPVDPTGEPPKLTGGEAVAHLDKGAPGRGGDERVPTPALNLADRDEQMRLSPNPLSHLDRDQLQRLRVARERQSWEDRRATTHPAELTLLATGMGIVLERRAAAPWMPSRGALESPSAGVRGGEPGGTPATAAEDANDRRAGGAQRGSLEGAPGLGVVDGRPGVDHHASAPIASARPDVTRGAVAVPAVDPARPRDNVDSDQEVATTIRALVHASTAGGVAGQGQGGNSGTGEAAAGGAAGTGSEARPLGQGLGDVFDPSMNNPWLQDYYRRLHAKIDPLWANAFPKSALYDLKQGSVTLEVTVMPDGRVSAVGWPPVRPSGIDEFDRNCADAVRRASPLPPLPRQLGVRSLRIRMPFTADNPIIK